MSGHRVRMSIEAHTETTDGYAFVEDARDATRYVQRVAVLRQALYHGAKTDVDPALWSDTFTGTVGERF